MVRYNHNALAPRRLMRSNVSVLRNDFSFEQAFTITARWKRDQASAVVADSRLPLRSSACSYDKISYGCPVVLGKTAESLEANEPQHAGDLPTMAILSRANSKLDDSVIFRRIPAHAVVNQTGIATSFLAAKIAEIMLSVYEVTHIARYGAMIEGPTVDPTNWQLLLLIADCHTFFKCNSKIATNLYSNPRGCLLT